MGMYSWGCICRDVLVYGCAYLSLTIVVGHMQCCVYV